MAGYGFGIIGTGGIAKVHAMAIESLPEARLIGCYDLSSSRSDEFASAHGIRSYHDIDSFLSDPDIDIVTITTPSGAHLEPALAAIKAKKRAVIIEKPLEITAERCDQLIKAADENGVMLSCVFQSRFHDAPRLVRKAIDEGRFGRITLIDAQIKWFRTQAYYDDISWHGTWKMDGGGALMNQGIHAIDLLRWFGGDVEDVSSRTATLAHERIEVEDTAGAVISFRSGAIGIIEGSTAAYPGFLKRIEICGSDGSAIIEEESLKFWQFREERPEDAGIRAKYSDFTSTGGGAGDPKAIGFHGHASEFADIMEALDTGREPAITGREAKKAVELIEAVYRSSREGKTVKL